MHRQLPSLDHDLFLINTSINAALSLWKQRNFSWWSDPLSPGEALEILNLVDSFCPFAEDDRPRMDKWMNAVEIFADELTVIDLR